MHSLNSLTIIGHSGKPHGINGELNIVFDYGVPEIPKSRQVYIVFNLDGTKVPFRINSVRSKGRNGAIVALKNINSEKDASSLADKDVYVPVDDFHLLFPGIEPEDSDQGDDGRVYLEDLIGFEALDEDASGYARHLGEVKAIDDATENVLFVIDRGKGPDLLVPAVDDFIVAIDQDERKLFLDVPEALLNINAKKGPKSQM